MQKLACCSSHEGLLSERQDWIWTGGAQKRQDAAGEQMNSALLPQPQLSGLDPWRDYGDVHAAVQDWIVIWVMDFCILLSYYYIMF